MYVYNFIYVSGSSLAVIISSRCLFLQSCWSESFSGLVQLKVMTSWRKCWDASWYPSSSKSPVNTRLCRTRYCYSTLSSLSSLSSPSPHLPPSPCFRLPLLTFISLSSPPSPRFRLPLLTSLSLLTIIPLFIQLYILYMCTATSMNFDLCTLASPTPGPGVIDPCEQEIEESASGAASPRCASHTFQRPSGPTTSCRKL